MEVVYKDHMGDDDFVCDMARVSFAKEASQFSTERNHKLIQYLAKHNHWAPMAHPQITLHETVPIFVAAQRMKHQIGFTYNSVSRRYVDDEPEFYTPPTWRSRPGGNIKQGSGGAFEGYFYTEEEGGVDTPLEDVYEYHMDTLLQFYNDMIGKGVAPEQARMVLPQSMLTSYYVTGSLAAFARAYRLRMDPDAQIEIQELATQWGNIIQPLFPCSWLALTEA